MKQFLATFMGSAQSPARTEWDKLDAAQRKQREAAGMAAWTKWGADHVESIVSYGAPIGKTKRIDASGVSDTKNQIAAYAIVQAEDHDVAAALFVNHPHFTVFPGDSVEVMECLPMPKL